MLAAAGWPHAGLAGENWWMHGYATVNVALPSLESEPTRRNSIDLERVTVEPGLRLARDVVLEAELEFEHGGTGAAFEYEANEEFGEFEQEVEKGGEVLLERFYLGWQVLPGFQVQAGRIALPFGTIARHDEPGDYLSVRRPDLETRLVPGLWTALGTGASWNGRGFRVSVSVTEGLDGSLFSNVDWAGKAEQMRFETAHLDGPAFAGQVDYMPLSGVVAGLSAYTCDVAANRPREDMKASARVWIFEAHAEWERGPVRARIQGIRGSLRNATELARRNRSLPNVLAVPRTAIGSVAQGAEAEIGYDLLSPWLEGEDAPQAWLWAGAHWSDAMAEVEAGTVAHPRALRRGWNLGLVLRPIPAVSVKAQHGAVELGRDGSASYADAMTELGLGLEF